ncbi:hypothetical protein A167_02912 [Alcanivorax sp. S71-1-4]|jgi:3-methyladenine DNA glycosylase Tag|uniref:DNA-3-methyladenine glycosylase I n=1 Tax=Alcanivorax sp. S71-1-4 TaxID=1177159 RepID=UPI00135BF998|nr:DNA-3-methyladenine glycosylase I [Alcanivorax sp. S71-1-4]KAF0807485.1 hypothetical protein A167_02912 [Alcanivorax sp. S71-1-4]
MKAFEDIFALACHRHGGEAAVRARLPEVASGATLRKRTDAWYLSTMMRRIFRAGLSHDMVDKKWPAFEDAFFGFEPEKLVLMSDHMLDERLQDTRLIRHAGKMQAIRFNAQMVREISREHGGFGRFLSEWPDQDIVGLWLVLGRKGKQLGGNSAPAFLRMAGRDTWYPTDDVRAGLIANGVIDRALSSQRDRRAAQAAINTWQAESGLPQAHVSRILSMTVG